MIYYKVNNDNKVIYIHHKPFDPIVGLHETEAELLTAGFLTLAFPDRPLPIIGKRAVLYHNPLRWVQIDKEITQEDKIRKMLEDGVLTHAQAQDLLGGIKL